MKRKTHAHVDQGTPVTRAAATCSQRRRGRSGVASTLFRSFRAALLFAIGLSLAAPAAYAAQLSLTWVDNSSNESGFRVERALAGLIYTEVAVVGPDVTTYTDSSLLPSVFYSYRVCAFNADGNSAYSNVVSTTAPSGTNTAPTISNVTDRSISKNANTGAIAFTVGDAESAASALTVSGSSSNTAVVPNANIVFGGSGTSRTVTITPAADAVGTSTITLSVSDGEMTTSDTFVLTVNGVAASNTAPTISDIGAQSTTQGTSTGAVSFTVGDSETATGSLTISGTSSNTALVPSANIVFGGSGASRTVTVTPVSGASGTATITVTVSNGALTSSDSFDVTVGGVGLSNSAPTISAVPVASANADGSFGPIAFTVGDAETSAASLVVTASSSDTAVIPDGNIVFGGSGANRTVTLTPAAGKSGSATVTFTVSDGALSSSAMSTFTVTGATQPDLVNLSTRGVSQPGDNVLIHGFVISGTATRKVLLRAVGPALASAPYNVQGTMADPRLTLKQWNGSTFVDYAANDDWGTNTNADEIKQVSAQVFAFALPDNSRDAALLLDLPPGQYTVVADNATNSSGVVIVELYDVEETPGASCLGNMSTRGYVGTGDDVLITGFVVSGDSPKKLLVRAVGPTLGLSPFNVSGVLADPKISIYRSNGDGTDTLVLSQDNWGDDANAADTAAATNQVSAFSLPSGSKDSAVVQSFAPGVYTVVVSGVNASTGIALVEVYKAE